MNDDQARWIAGGLDNISDSIEKAAHFTEPISHAYELREIACGLGDIAMAINRLADALQD